MWMDEYERMAMKGDPMPNDLSLPNQLYFQFLSLLYARFKRKEIDRDSAAKEKGMARHRRNVTQKKIDAGSELSKWHHDLKVRIESAANDYAKDRTLENADKLYKALYGMEPTKKEET